MQEIKENKYNYYESPNIRNEIFSANKKLNEMEVKELKLVLQSKPIRLGVVLTNKCNLRCIMCPHTRNCGDTTLSKEAVKKIYELLPYLERISWQGGEIFLIDYMKDVFKEIAGYKNVKHDITTNGLLLDEAWINVLLNLNVHFLFSIDSAVPEEYEFIRRGASFNNLLKKIKLLNATARSYQKNVDKIIEVVVMRSNLNNLELFVDFANEYNFKTIEFYPVAHIDNEENIFKNTAQEIQLVLNGKMEKIKKLVKDTAISIHDFLPIFSNKDNNDRNNRQFENEQLFCTLPWTSLWIDAGRGGDVFPNCMCKQKLGNIYKDNILSLWNNSKMVNYRKNILYNNLNFCEDICISGIIDPGLLCACNSRFRKYYL